MAHQKNDKPVALITGGASFLGSAISRKLAREGFRMILHFQNSLEKTRRLARELSAIYGETPVLKGDLGKTGQINGLVDKAAQKFKRLDLLVNSASLFSPTPIHKSASEEWEEIFRVNLFSPFFLSQSAFPWLRKAKGCIVNLTDIYGEHPILQNYSAYCVSKAGLVCLTKTLAKEFGPDVRVNGVSPGAIFIPSNFGPKKRQELIDRSALRRQGTPEEIADAVFFMASQRFVTGQILNVDGGRFL